MTEQELRDEFENWANKVSVSKYNEVYFVIFKSGYLLAQETIEKQKKEIEELQKRSYKYYGLSEQLKLDKKILEETIKAKDAEINKLGIKLKELRLQND